jgi:predicted transcriptional regulator of viral defense system
MPPEPNDQQLVQMIRSLGVVSAADLESQGIPRARLYRLVREGLLERVDRGLYVTNDHDGTEGHALALVAKRAPCAVVCLISALQFHELTTQIAHEVWIAIPEKARRPRITHPPLRIVRFSGAALSEGVEVHRIEGVPVHITSAAKTVADCFKYRNKIGLDVALEALRDAWRARKVTMEEIDRFARICRVQRIMRPYLEALVA